MLLYAKNAQICLFRFLSNALSPPNQFFHHVLLCCLFLPCNVLFSPRIAICFIIFFTYHQNNTRNSVKRSWSYQKLLWHPYYVCAAVQNSFTWHERHPRLDMNPNLVWMTVSIGIMYENEIKNHNVEPQCHMSVVIHSLKSFSLYTCILSPTGLLHFLGSPG